MPCCCGPAGAKSGSSTISGDVVGPAVADRDRLADQRAGGLHLASMFAGDMFLPAALMISSFLRSTILR